MRNALQLLQSLRGSAMGDESGADLAAVLNRLQRALDLLERRA